MLLIVYFFQFLPWLFSSLCFFIIIIIIIIIIIVVVVLFYYYIYFYFRLMLVPIGVLSIGWIDLLENY